MASLLKSFAIAAGAGLGACASTVLLSRQTVQRSSSRPSQPGTRRLSDDELLRLEPVLDRIERIEAFVDAASSIRQETGNWLSPDAELRLREQELSLHRLQSTVNELEKRAGDTLEMVRSSVETLRSEVPGLVESTVAARIADLEIRLQADARNQWNQTLETFETRLEQRISERISAIERALESQSASIAIMRARSEESDANLQRLIASIERLCQVIPPPQPVNKPQPLPVPRSLREPEPEKSGMSFTRIFGALFAFGMSRFLR